MTETLPETTTTVGYFNSQKYAIHVVISEYNVNLRLDPGRYVEDTHGRKINDPFFDRYKLLAKETGEAALPVLRLKRPSSIPPVRDGQSVRQITEFKLDAHGHRHPVMPHPSEVEVPAISAAPVRALSMAEARKAGLVRRVREVPEDYGTPDTAGMPPTNIPEMKVAVDTAVHSKPAPLPPAAKVMTAAVQPTAGIRESVQATLETAAASEPELVNPISRLPEVTALQTDEPALPEPQLEAAKPEAVKPAPQPLPARKRYVCAADGRSFDYRSQLDMHVQRKFPAMRVELMKPYPPEG